MRERHGPSMGLTEVTSMCDTMSFSTQGIV